MAATALTTEVFGHDDVRLGLAAAVERDDLPGSILIHGMPGVGRQSLARWLARLLVCQRPEPGGPCGRCRGCRLALDLQHPDIHWFFPLPRPKGTAGPEKLAAALEEARFAALAERRGDPLYLADTDEPAGLYIAQVRTIRQLGVTRPAMASRQVFIIGDAELLVSQEASEEAANALLKILEEPPPATVFILTARDPEALVPTIRSRLLPVRLTSFSVDEIATFLHERADVPRPDAAVLARLGRGSIRAALSFVSRDGEPTHAQTIRSSALEWIRSTLDPGPERRLAIALAQKPFGARGSFADTLDAMAIWLRDLAAVAAGAHDQVVALDALDTLEAMAGQLRPDRLPVALALVDTARDAGRINANPQLTLGWLLAGISTALRS